MQLNILDIVDYNLKSFCVCGIVWFYSFRFYNIADEEM